MDDDGDGEAGGGHVAGRRIAKRARRNKGLVVGYDESARKEYVTGFRKRKNKRRKVAEEQKKEKERQKRLVHRKERRIERKRAFGLLSPDPENPENVEGAEEEQETEDMDMKDSVVYEDENTRTVVNTCTIVSEDLDGVDRNVVVVPSESKSRILHSTQKTKAKRQPTHKMKAKRQPTHKTKGKRHLTKGKRKR